MDQIGKYLHAASPTASKTGKTKEWLIYSGKDGADTLIGHVSWFGRWWRYAFYPEDDTVFEQGCMRELADFCELQTENHKKQLKKFRSKR